VSSGGRGFRDALRAASIRRQHKISDEKYQEERKPDPAPGESPVMLEVDIPDASPWRERLHPSFPSLYHPPVASPRITGVLLAQSYSL